MKPLDKLCHGLQAHEEVVKDFHWNELQRARSFATGFPARSFISGYTRTDLAQASGRIALFCSVVGEDPFTADDGFGQGQTSTLVRPLLNRLFDPVAGVVELEGDN